MKIHFSQLLFTLLSFGSGFRVQGSGFRGEVAASPLFLEDGILVSQPSSLKRMTEGQRISFVDDGFLAFH